MKCWHSSGFYVLFFVPFLSSFCILSLRNFIYSKNLNYSLDSNGSQYWICRLDYPPKIQIDLFNFLVQYLIYIYPACPKLSHCFSFPLTCCSSCAPHLRKETYIPPSYSEAILSSSLTPPSFLIPHHSVGHCLCSNTQLLCGCRGKTIIDNTQMNGQGCVLLKLIHKNRW